jgi:hypothetical protein
MDRCLCGHSEEQHIPTGACRAGVSVRHFALVPEITPPLLRAVDAPLSARYS